jgi:hypothetical protein
VNNSLLLVTALCGALGLVSSGCGSSEKEGQHPDPAHEGHDHSDPGHNEPGHDQAEGHGEEHEGHHAQMGGAVKAFHDVLAPVFHMEKGPGRVESTCKVGGSLKEQAALVESEAGSDEAAKKRATKLVFAVIALQKGCLEEGRATVESDLDSVHEAFHAVMEKK